MSQCIGKTKTGHRCTRSVKSKGDTCFQHNTRKTKTSPQRKTEATVSAYGRKVRLNQLPCRASPDKYIWVVRKGCYEKPNVKQSVINPPVKPNIIKPHVNEDLKCRSLKCIKREGRDQRGLEIMTFPKDHYIFRSAIPGTFYPTTWYSDEAVAREYHEQGTTKCRGFITKRVLRLINLGDIQTIRAMLREPSLSERERYAIFYVTGVDAPQKIKARRDNKDLDGRGKYMVFSPTGFLFPEDMGAMEFANVKFAKAVCKFGYDGWVIPQKSVIDGTSGHFFMEEVMLCKPADVLIPTEIKCDKTY